ncbi:MAG TPA: UDP-N-acetylmuramoyl-tripeptide--D-alanyl-D-alanine ligase [Candidatus Paceibacterota bacterium]
MISLFKSLIVSLLTLEARYALRVHKPRIIAVVGSVGKTSTKDAIYAALSPSFFVRKSEKSFNSEVGIPLTILGCPTGWRNPLRWVENLFDGLILLFSRSKYPEWLVLEVGADRPGDIAKVAAWLPVDIVVVTRLPDVPVHVEYFDSPLQVIEEKAHILKALKKDGWFIANADDPAVLALRSRTSARVLTYGMGENADIRACEFSVLSEKEGYEYPVGITAYLDCEDARVPVSIMGTIGAHQILSALAGYAVGKTLGREPKALSEALSTRVPAPGRMRLISGLKKTLIIDDTYNSSPTAVAAALEGLRLVTGAKRKIAVLGDMLELGKYSSAKHKEAGTIAADIADLLITVGFRARDIADGALSAGLHESKILQFEDSGVAGNALEELLQEGDCVLVKGSQSMRMERIVEEVMAEPEKATQLLVRQEHEWKRR